MYYIKAAECFFAVLFKKRSGDMMSVSEKVAYLKGLVEGLGLDDTTKEGKILKAIVDVLGDISEDIDSLKEYTTELSEQIDAIDEDLDALESEFYGYDDEEDVDDDYDDFDQDYYDIVCPNCDNEFSVDEEVLMQGSIKCPVCGETLEFDIEDCDCCDDDECGCSDEE